MARILVADDNASLRRVICHFLREGGHETVEARDGREALQILGKFQVDAVLMDVMMPRMDGFTACRRITTDPRWEGIPVVIVTARDRKADVLRASFAGASDYLLKPFGREALLSRIRRVLEARRAERRRAARATVEWSVLGSGRTPSGAAFTFRERALNVSHTGIAVSLDRLDGPDRLKESTPLDLHVSVEGNGAFRACGVVVHKTPSPADPGREIVGIRFAQLEPSAEGLIARRVRSVA